MMISDMEFSSRENALKIFLIPIFFLLSFGIVMVYSSSYLYGKELFHNSAYFLIKQLFFIVAGSIGILLLRKVPLDKIFNWGGLLHLLLLIFLLLTLIPGIGLKIKGAQRWLNFGIVYLQPGEFVKYTVPFCAIPLFENILKLNWKEIVWRLMGLFAPLISLILQPDFGAFTIYLLVVVFVAFLSSFPRKWFYAMVFFGTCIGPAILFSRAYRVQRILTYLDPWKDPKNTGFQIIQSYLAFAGGGAWGKGPGNSDEKLLYLPEAYNDFIFSIVGEEFGFIGVVFISLIFVLLVFFGFNLALKTADRFFALLIAGIVFALGIQAFLNMAVVLGLLPTKGLNLPLISYGGSSLLSNCFALGVVISVFTNQMQKNI